MRVAVAIVVGEVGSAATHLDQACEPSCVEQQRDNLQAARDCFRQAALDLEGLAARCERAQRKLARKGGVAA